MSKAEELARLDRRLASAREWAEEMDRRVMKYTRQLRDAETGSGSAWHEVNKLIAERDSITNN